MSFGGHATRRFWACRKRLLGHSCCCCYCPCCQQTAFSLPMPKRSAPPNTDREVRGAGASQIRATPAARARNNISRFMSYAAKIMPAVQTHALLDHISNNRFIAHRLLFVCGNSMYGRSICFRRRTQRRVGTGNGFETQGMTIIVRTSAWASESWHGSVSWLRVRQKSKNEGVQETVERCRPLSHAYGASRNGPV